MRELLGKLSLTLGNLGLHDEITSLVEQALESGILPKEIFEEGMVRGIEIVSKRYDEKQYFISDLIMAASLMEAGMNVLEPHLLMDKSQQIGTILTGTVRGDMHDIGKNILIAVLKSAGFLVYDLGIDVPPQEFIEKCREIEPDVIAMSSLLTSTKNEMSVVIDFLKEARLRDKVKVILGGRCVTQEFADDIGADAYAVDCWAGVEQIKQFLRSEGRPEGC